MAKTADKLGVTTEALAGLQHAAELTGVAQETLNKSLTKQQKALFDADRGLLTYSQHFDALGLSTKELMKLSPDKQFIEIAGALNKIENQTKKTAIAYDIFGGRGTALLNTLALGKEGLEAAAEEAKLYGIALSRIETAKIEMENDQFTRSLAIMKGVGHQITIKLAPVIAGLNQAFIDAATQSGSMANFVSKGMKKVAMVVASTANFIRGLAVVWKISEVAALGFVAASLSAFEVIANLESRIDKFLGIKRKGPTISGQLGKEAETFRLILINANTELDALVNKKMPAASFKEWTDDLVFNFNKAAEKIAAQKESMLMPSATGGAVDSADKLANAVTEVGKETKKTDGIAQSLGLTFSSAFEDAIVEGGKLSDMLKGLEKDILRIITRQLVTEPLAQGISGFISSAGPSIFGGARANGGPVSAGRSFLVGEKGPELFTPANSGTITPNGQVGGMTVNKRFVIEAPQGTISRESQQQVAAAASLGISRASRRNN